MTFTEKFLDNRTYQRFAFFANGDGAVGNMDETVDMGRPFELGTIMVNFSGVCSADIYLRGTLDAIVSGSVATTFDTQFLSYALSNSVWYRWQPSAVKMIFMSGDKIQISCVTDNLWALVVTGWAATVAK
jgi:hypothetical protein